METVITNCPTSHTPYMNTKTTQFDDLKKIYILKTFSTQGSLNKTAQIHKVTPSAVSQTIKSLETSLGYPVIIKQNDKWQITEKGQELLRNAEKVFKAMSESFPSAVDDQLRLVSLSIGTLENLATDVIHGLSHKVRSDHSNIKLNYQILRSSEIIKKIQSGELCLGVISEIDDLPSHFISEKISSDKLGLYVAETSPIETIETETQIMFGSLPAQATGLPSYLRKFLKDQPSFKPNVICDSYEVLKSLAQKEEAISLLPESVAKKSTITLKNIAQTNLTHQGNHSILLVASGTCDQREFKYVSKILKDHFARL